MFKLIVPVIAVLSLSACAGQSSSMGEATVVQAATAASGMTWNLGHDGAIAKLSYGVANSDQLALMMTCMPGDTTAVVYGDLHPEGSVAPDPANATSMSDGEGAETRVALKNSGLSGLASDGTLDVRGQDGAYRLTANSAERGTVRDFLAYCGTGRA